MKNAWASAEPGTIFWSTVKRFSTTEYFAPVMTTNPCSEIPLEPYGDCCLGNVNLSKFVLAPFTEEARVDWENLEKALRYTVRFLDDVLDYNRNRHPLRAQTEASMRSRRIGVGFTGLADMLAKLRVRYDTEEAIQRVEALFRRIKEVVYDESANIAREKGSFPAFDPEKHFRSPFFEGFPQSLLEKLKGGLRNAALLTVPPVGSGSVLAGCSSGIEPIFALSYIRRSESLSKETYRVYHPLVREYMDRFGIEREEDLPDFFVTAHQIRPEFRVRMQATIQRHIDHSISSTVNLPRDIPWEEVAEIYRLAWKEGCKGITVYREGSREGILITEEAGEGAEEAVEGRLTPRPRPQVLVGKTYKLRTDMGNVYITVNGSDHGPFEVFIHLGKSGSTLMAFAEAIGRLVSLALRSGVNPYAVIHQLEGIKSGPPIRQEDGTVVFSVPDAIAKSLQRFLMEVQELPPQNGGTGNGGMIFFPEKPVFKLDAQGETGLSSGDICPECGGLLVFQGGCYTCVECGYSKCE